MSKQKQAKGSSEFFIQDNEYKFPYHYVPYIDEDGLPNRIRIHNNGFEYLTYVNYCIKLIKDTGSDSLLEVGCGDGRILNMLNNKKAVGVDLSQKAISFAKAFNYEMNIIEGDANDIKETFDVVIAIEVLEHIPDEVSNDFWKTLYNKLNKGGKLIVSVPSVNKPLIKKHFRHYNKEVLTNEIKSAGLEDKFEFKSIQYVYAEDRMVRVWKRLSNNKYWIFELKSFKNYIWKRIQKKLTKVSPDRGLHLIVELIKIA